MTPGTIIEMRQWALKYGRAVDFHNERTTMAALAFQEALDKYAEALRKDSFEGKVFRINAPEPTRNMNLIALKQKVRDAYLRLMQALNDSLERFRELEKGILNLPESGK